MRYLIGALLVALAFVAAPAKAQDALVVQTCGTLPLAYSAGATRLVTVDTTGKLCSSAGGGGGVTVGAAVTGGSSGCNLFVTSTSTVGCVAAVSETDTGSVLTLTGNLAMPTTASASVGVITFGGVRMLHDSGATTNTFLGQAAGQIATTGIANTALGSTAGTSLAAGVGNVLVGSGAGNNVAGGSANTIVGQNGAQQIVSGSNNTIIGQGVAGLAAGTANTIILAIGGGVIEADWAFTTAGAWSFNGPIQATLASAIGTNAVCNTPAAKSALTVQVWATGCAASSARFKEGIAFIDKEQALADVLAFQPVSYFYKPEFNMGFDKHVGFTAEQIATIDPQWVTYEADGVTPHAVKYQEMAPLFAAAIQQLKADNDNLRAELEDLKRRVR